MARQSKIDQAFAKLKPDFELLDKLHKKEQKEYIRTRLKAIRWLWEGKSRSEIEAKLDIDRTSLLSWIKVLIVEGVEQGLKLLAQGKKIKKSGKLSFEQQESLLDIIENEKPSNYGYEQNIFTGQILVEVVQKKWQIEVTDQTIYNILHRQGFSYQRGHRDYDNADPLAQEAYALALKRALQNKADDEKFVFFDEFSVSNRPTTFYGWARVNTKFKVPSNEKKSEND